MGCLQRGNACGQLVNLNDSRQTKENPHAAGLVLLWSVGHLCRVTLQKQHAARPLTLHLTACPVNKVLFAL